jgi:hypothetical protein
VLTMPTGDSSATSAPEDPAANQTVDKSLKDDISCDTAGVAVRGRADDATRTVAVEEDPHGPSTARRQLSVVRERFQQAWEAYNEVAASLVSRVQESRQIVGEHSLAKDELVANLVVRSGGWATIANRDHVTRLSSLSKLSIIEPCY